MEADFLGIGGWAESTQTPRNIHYPVLTCSQRLGGWSMLLSAGLQQPHYFLISGLPVYLMAQEEIKSSCMCVELCMYPCGLPPGTSTHLNVCISFTEFDGVHAPFEGLFLLAQAPAYLWSINNKMAEYCGMHSGTLACCGFIYTQVLVTGGE